MSPGVVVVGASVAGVTLVRSLRAEGHPGRIRLLDRELEEPYDKPPLSKGGLASPPRLLTRAEADELGVELLLGHEATSLDPSARCVGLADGSRLEYDALVLATGVRARPAPWTGPHVHVLRTLADARMLHADLAGGGALVVLGAGFIGAEVASVATTWGCRVTLVDPLPNPPGRVVGDRVGSRILDQHRRAGVSLRLGTRVESLQHRHGGLRLRLTDGEELRADHVLVGIGAQVDTGWLAGSGLHLDDGIECDRFGRALGAHDVFAIGDVARWRAEDGTGHRVEHWASAQEQARCVAATLTDPRTPRGQSEVPMVWSDQHGHTIQVLGRVDPETEPTLVEQGDRLLAVWQRDGRVSGAVTVGWPKASLAARRGIAAGASPAEVIDSVAPRVAVR